MNGKDLIIYLIKQDMRHYQFVSKLESIGMDMDDHFLDIMSVVAEMMGVSRENVPDVWADLYTKFLDEAKGTEENELEKAAAGCYAELEKLIS